MSKVIVIYDFDGTLTPNSVPKIDFLETIGYDNKQYEQKMKEWLVINPDKSIYDAFYITYLTILKENNFPLNDETFALAANKNDYNPGVLNYFENTKLLVKNYLVSSGFKVPLLHSPIAPYFEEIYGTTFSYDKNALATGIEYAMGDKRKVDKIKEICELNQLPTYDCSTIIYLGDGLTDEHAMAFVKEHGGTPIFVYQPNSSPDAFTALKNKGVVDLAFVADYTEDSDLYTTLMKLIKEKSVN